MARDTAGGHANFKSGSQPKVYPKESKKKGSPERDEEREPLKPLREGKDPRDPEKGPETKDGDKDEDEEDSCWESCGRCVHWCWWEGEFKQVKTENPDVYMLERRSTRCCRVYRWFIWVLLCPIKLAIALVKALFAAAMSWWLWLFVIPAIVVLFMVYYLMQYQNVAEAPVDAAETTAGTSEFVYNRG
jgi:hypothetical protein